MRVRISYKDSKNVGPEFWWILKTFGCLSFTFSEPFFLFLTKMWILWLLILGEVWPLADKEKNKTVKAFNKSKYILLFSQVVWVQTEQKHSTLCCPAWWMSGCYFFIFILYDDKSLFYIYSTLSTLAIQQCSWLCHVFLNGETNL